MSYRFEPREPVVEGIRRMAREQVDQALDGLTEPGDDPDTAIHDARKRFKKVRAVLRLVRLEIGEEAFDRENVAYRDAGRLLSEVRESHVAGKTVAALAEAFPETLHAGLLDGLREALQARHREILDAARVPDGPVDRAVRIVREARERIDGWPVEDRGWQALAGGLRKVYKRGRNRMADAWADPEGPEAPERFHEWRKRTKYLWYHVRILRPAWRPVLEPLAEEIHHVANVLGDANDLTDLKRLLEEEPGLAPSREAARAVGLLAGGRRRELWDASRVPGCRIWTETPDDFRDRMGAYFEASRRR